MDADELIAALTEAMQAGGAGPEAMTSNELIAASGVAREPLLGGLRALQRAGRLEVVKVVRRDLSGRMMRVPGYRLRQ